jgi:hypothetical protein
LRAVPAQPDTIGSTLLAKQPGFSLHAAICFEPPQRDKLEKLCRYIIRQATGTPDLDAAPQARDRGDVQ